jgi:hypothetical protein
MILLEIGVFNAEIEQFSNSEAQNDVNFFQIFVGCQNGEVLPTTHPANV